MKYKEAIEQLKLNNPFMGGKDKELFSQAIDKGIEALENQKTGHWIEKEDYNGDTYYDCSECGESFCLIEGTPTDNLYNYCPNCGAKMEGENNESN